jgi:hypothetical protein
VIEVFIVKIRGGGIYGWPWWEAGGFRVVQSDGNLLDGVELRAATMLEF